MAGTMERFTTGVARDVVAFVNEVIRSRLLYAGIAGIITSLAIQGLSKDFYFYFIPEQGEGQTYMAAIFLALLTGFWYLVLSVYALFREDEDPFVLAAIVEVYGLSVLVWILATYQANIAEVKWWEMMFAGNTTSITIAIFVMFGIALFIALVNLGMTQRDNVALNRLGKNLAGLEGQGAAVTAGGAERFLKCEGCGLRYDSARHGRCPKCGRESRPPGVVDEKLLDGIGRGLVRRRVEFFLRLIEEGKPLDRDSVTAADSLRYSLRASYSKYLMGLLTLTGLFGTFVGLMFALEGIQGVVDTLSNFTDITRLQQTMTQSVKGLQTAFGTSLAGLACGMPGGLYLLIVTNLQAKFYAKFEDFTTRSFMPFLTRREAQLVARRASVAQAVPAPALEIEPQPAADFEVEDEAAPQPPPPAVAPPARASTRTDGREAAPSVPAAGSAPRPAAPRPPASPGPGRGGREPR